MSVNPPGFTLEGSCLQLFALEEEEQRRKEEAKILCLKTTDRGAPEAPQHSTSAADGNTSATCPQPLASQRPQRERSSALAAHLRVSLKVGAARIRQKRASGPRPRGR